MSDEVSKQASIGSFGVLICGAMLIEKRVQRQCGVRLAMGNVTCIVIF